MNKKKSIWSGVSVLIAAVLAIVAFVRHTDLASDSRIYHLGDLGHGRIRIPLYTGTGKRKAARRPQSSL